MPLNPDRHTLPNGVTLIVKENATTPAVSILAGVCAGGYEDPAGREGTAALLARVLDRGTTTRTADAIADDLDGRGASLTVSAGRHMMGVSATCLADDFAPVLATLADIVRTPALPADDIETRRAELLTTILQDEDDPASVAVDALMDALYAGHPYARRVRGTARSVKGLSREDLVAFHRARVVPPALTIVIVGSVASSMAVDRVRAGFAEWTGGGGWIRAEVPDAAAAGARRAVSMPMRDKAQADVAYGFVGVRRADPDYLASAVMNNALGQYALGGRLGDSIRERQGMAYYVFSTLDAGLGPGPLMIRAGVSAANIDPTIRSIDTELAAIRSEGFTEKEVAESRQYMIGALPRQLETNGGIASFLLNAEMLGLGLDYDARLPGLLAAVGRDAVVDAARRLMDPARATVAVAGPVPEP